jgi:hypothetical protein
MPIPHNRTDILIFDAVRSLQEELTTAYERPPQTPWIQEPDVGVY